MQFDDILFLLVIGFGIISSLIGSKVKKKQTPRPQTKRPATRSSASTGPKEPGSDRRKQVLSEMERIFQELQGGKPQTPSPPSRPKVRPPPPEQKPKPKRVPAPAPVARGDEAKSLETLVPAGGESHVRFHEEYISEFVGTQTKVPVARAVSHLSAKRLREAILVQEILGPPKSLRDV